MAVQQQRDQDRARDHPERPGRRAHCQDHADAEHRHEQDEQRLSRRLPEQEEHRDQGAHPEKACASAQIGRRERGNGGAHSLKLVDEFVRRRAAPGPGHPMSNASPDLVVAIVNHSNRDDTLACLESLAGDAGRRASVRVVVLDNASDDGSVDAIRAAHPDVEVIAQDVRRGFGANQNAIIQATASRYVLALNNDTLVAARRSRHARALPRRASRRGRGRPARGRRPAGEPQLSAWTFPTVWNAAVHIVAGSRPSGSAPAAVGYLSGCALMLRRSVLTQIGGFDEDYFMYAEEKDLCRRIHDAGYAVHLVPSASVVHLEARSSAGASERRETEFWRSQRLYLRKHHSPAGALAIEAQTAAQRFVLAAAVALVGALPARLRLREIEPGTRARARTPGEVVAEATARPGPARAGGRAQRAAAPGRGVRRRLLAGRVRRRARRHGRRLVELRTARSRGSGSRPPTSSSRPRRRPAALEGGARRTARRTRVLPAGRRRRRDGHARARAACEGPGGARLTRRRPRAARAHGARDGALERRRPRSAGRCPRSARAALGQAAQRLAAAGLLGLHRRSALAARRRLPGHDAGRRPVGLLQPARCRRDPAATARAAHLVPRLEHARRLPPSTARTPGLRIRASSPATASATARAAGGDAAVGIPPDSLPADASDETLQANRARGRRLCGAPARARAGCRALLVRHRRALGRPARPGAPLGRARSRTTRPACVSS